MRRHLQRKIACDNAGPDHKCPHCDKMFVREINMRLHRETCPSAPKPVEVPNDPDLQTLRTVMTAFLARTAPTGANTPITPRMPSVNITTLFGYQLPPGVRGRNANNPILDHVSITDVVNAIVVSPDTTYRLFALIYADPNYPENHSIRCTSQMAHRFIAIVDGDQAAVTDTYAVTTCSQAAIRLLDKLPREIYETIGDKIEQVKARLSSVDPHHHYWVNRRYLETINLVSDVHVGQPGIFATRNEPLKALDPVDHKKWIFEIKANNAFRILVRMRAAPTPSYKPIHEFMHEREEYINNFDPLVTDLQQSMRDDMDNAATVVTEYGTRALKYILALEGGEINVQL